MHKYLHILKYGLKRLKTYLNKLRLIPPASDRSRWLLGTVGPLPPSNVTARVTCTIENKDGKEKGSTREIERDLKVVVVDVDNHPPVPQHEEISCSLKSREFKKASCDTGTKNSSVCEVMNTF
ncbi:hypothetical protein NQ317_007075 [Molorchus minor]|uniref:Uncharacterized protein n=1 Tax=Molorchus minor TaxID=1323400 RepID=A0ABQ9K4E3_9CUCU|nr:hypothetical protein NQ317_007075 [Molorchus minor]